MHYTVPIAGLDSVFSLDNWRKVSCLWGQPAKGIFYGFSRTLLHINRKETFISSIFFIFVHYKIPLVVFSFLKSWQLSFLCYCCSCKGSRMITNYVKCHKSSCFFNYVSHNTFTSNQHCVLGFVLITLLYYEYMTDVTTSLIHIVKIFSSETFFSPHFNFA